MFRALAGWRTEVNLVWRRWRYAKGSKAKRKTGRYRPLDQVPGGEERISYARQNSDDNERKSARRVTHTLTAEDVFGMFEAGLQELSAHFVFDAVNAPGGVRLTISGIERIDHADGTWSLRIQVDGVGEGANNASHAANR